MLYDLLEPYKMFLRASYSPETAKKYYNWIELLLQGQNLVCKITDIDIDSVIVKLTGISHKNEFSQAKNSLLHFLEFEHIKVMASVHKSIEQFEKNTRKKYRKFRVIHYPTIDKKIKSIRNERLKMSYQVMLITGLRVSELAQIRKCDSIVSENNIEFRFIAKGGKNNVVAIDREVNYKLTICLINLIEKTNANEKIFYSSNYLQRKAKELGFQCHDLRRIFAKAIYKKTKSKIEVMKNLRHTSLKNTNIYLHSHVEL